MQTTQIGRQRHITVVLHISFLWLKPSRIFNFCGCLSRVPCVCCVSVRSAAPDFHELNEDGELWLVSQGLKETIRWNWVFWFTRFASFSQGRMCAAVSFLRSPLFSLLASVSLTSLNFFVGHVRRVTWVLLATLGILYVPCILAPELIRWAPPTWTGLVSCYRVIIR